MAGADPPKKGGKEAAEEVWNSKTGAEAASGLPQQLLVLQHRLASRKSETRLEFIKF